MTQTWYDLLFAHWPVPVALLRALVPPTLAIDTFDGEAWLGIIPFHMTVRLRGLPAVPGLSAFPELNVRTYVTVEGKPGVFFFSLDAGNRLIVAIARQWYRLPYFRARMTVDGAGDAVRYASRRIHQDAPPAEFAAQYRPVGDVFRAPTSSLAHWLTERYCLYTPGSRGRLRRGEIHHEPWPLQPAAARLDRNTMTLGHDIPLPATAPLLHFARRLRVIFWPLETLPLLP
jgi:hypothetical protein